MDTYALILYLSLLQVPQTRIAKAKQPKQQATIALRIKVVDNTKMFYTFEKNLVKMTWHRKHCLQELLLSPSLKTNNPLKLGRYVDGHQQIMRHYLLSLNGSEQIKGQAENLTVAGVNGLFALTRIFVLT